MTTAPATPPMDPGSSEADERQLRLAVEQGAAYRKALDHMAQDVAKAGGTQQVGDYLIGYAIEDAEGMYHLQDGGYTLRVHVDPPTFMRHDEINGRRFAEPVDVEFAGVRIERGTEPVDPPGARD